MELNLGNIEDCTTAMGPGKRMCIWVRGCTIGCKGCATPQYWSADPIGLTQVGAVIQRLHASHAQHELEGMSFSGGEPFEQARALKLIAQSARALGLSTLSWSGYTLDYLTSPRAPDGSAELLRELDVLIDGAYVQALNTEVLPLRGSTNQTIHFLTDRYLPKDIGPARFSVQVADGVILSHGVTHYGRLSATMRLLGARPHAT